MLPTRFLLIGLASLNSAWSLMHFLGEYQRFLTQSFDPLSHATPLDPAAIIAWLAVGIGSGLAASVLFRAPYRGRRRIDQTIAVPTLTQLT